MRKMFSIKMYEYKKYWTQFYGICYNQNSGNKKKFDKDYNEKYIFVVFNKIIMIITKQ